MGKATGQKAWPVQRHWAGGGQLCASMPRNMERNSRACSGLGAFEVLNPKNSHRLCQEAAASVREQRGDGVARGTACLVGCFPSMRKAPNSIPITHKPSTCHPNALEVEAGAPEIQGYLEITSSESSLGYIRPYLKKKIKNK